MNLGISDISFAVGFDLLVKDCIKTAWLAQIDLGENLLDAFGARFKVNVVRKDEGATSAISVRAILQSAEKIQGFRIRLEFMLPKNFSEFFAPGIFYRDNRHTYAAPTFFLADHWVLREDRLALRSVSAFDPTKGGFIVMRLDEPAFEPPQVFYRKLCGNFILPSTDFDAGSLGFDRKRPSIKAFLPAWEGDLRYYEKLKFTPPLGWVFPPLTDKKVEASYLVEFCEGDRYKLLEKMIELAWKHQKRPDAKEPDFSKIERALVEPLKTRYFESRKIKGLYSWVETFTNKPVLGVCEPGFTGMVFLSCAKMLEHSKRTRDSQSYEIAKNVLDSWCKKAVKKNGFIPDFWMHWIGVKKFQLKLDTPATFEPPFVFGRHFSTRRASEAAWGLIEAVKIESSNLWTEKALAICDRIESLQQKDGSFPRQVFSSAQKRDPEIGATPSALFALAKACELFNDRYKNAVKRAGEFVADKMVGSFEFYGSTLDSNCEDKEAMLIASMSLWDAAKILDSQEMKDAAQKAAIAAASWFFLWEPSIAKNSLLSQAGLKLSGLSSVSSENNHADVYLFAFPSALTEIATSAGKPSLSKIAQFSLYRALEYVPTSELGPFRLGKEEVRFQVGVVPELIYHTDWTYYHLPIAVKSRHLAQGCVNSRSAAWCSASLLEALSSWKKLRSEQ